MKTITRDELKRYYKTNRQDVCLGNDSYNLSRGYCSIKTFLFLEGIAKQKYGYDYKYHKLTADILKREYLIDII